MNSVFTGLIHAATNGNVMALAQLISLSFSTNIFIARRASRVLRDKFNIETTK